MKILGAQLETIEAIRGFASIQLAFTMGQAIAAGLTRGEIIGMLDETIKEMNTPADSTRAIVDLLKPV